MTKFKCKGTNYQIRRVLKLFLKTVWTNPDDSAWGQKYYVIFFVVNTLGANAKKTNKTISVLVSQDHPVVGHCYFNMKQNKNEQK